MIYDIFTIVALNMLDFIKSFNKKMFNIVLVMIIYIIHGKRSLDRPIFLFFSLANAFILFF